MDQVGESTRGMMSEWEQASAVNSMLATGIAQTTAEAAELIDAGITLTTVFKANGASMDRYIRLLQNGSKFLFDNFGMSMALVDANTKLIMSTTNLSRDEAKLQAIREYAIAHGKRYRDSIGELARTQRQLNAATTDFKAAVGESLKPALVDSRKGLVVLIRKSLELKEGYDELIESNDAFAQSMKRSAIIARVMLFPLTVGIQAPLLALGLLTEETNNLTAAQAANTRAMGLYTFGYTELSESIEKNVFHMELLEARMTDQRKIFVDNQEAIRTWSYDASEAFAEVNQAALDYKNSLGTMFLEMGTMQTDSAASTQDYYTNVGDITATAAENREDAETKLSESLANIEDERYKKIDWVRSGHWTRTKEGAQEAEGWWNAHYDRLTEEALAAHEEQISDIDEAEATKKCKIAAAQAEAEAAQEAAFKRLRLKMALHMLDANEILQQLPGFAGLSADDAVVAIESGLLPIPAAVASVIGQAGIDIAKTQGEAVTTAETSMELIDQAFAGTLKTSIIPAIKETGETVDTTFGNIEGRVLDTKNNAVVPFDEGLMDITNSTLPGLGLAANTMAIAMRTDIIGIKQNAVGVLNASLSDKTTGTVGAL